MKQLRKPFQHTQTLVIKEVRKQVQEDIIAFIDADSNASIISSYGRTWRCRAGWEYQVGDESLAEYRKNVLCQIVLDNFERLEDK